MTCTKRLGGEHAFRHLQDIIVHQPPPPGAMPFPGTTNSYYAEVHTCACGVNVVKAVPAVPT